MNKNFRTNLSQLKYLAFTLAETLIVMGIIGVVAALTLPNLNSSTGEKEKVVKLQKIYSNLQDAFGRAEAVYGPFNEWFANDGNDYDKRTKRAFDRITEFMKYSKVCTVNDACTLFDAGDSSGGNRYPHAIILPDGATVGFSRYGSGLSHDTDLLLNIYIDLDGTNKGANKHCTDVFYLNIDTDNFNKQKYIVTYGYRAYVKDNQKLASSDVSSCTTWALVNGNMDYLKLDSNGRCPDGQELQFGVKTSCK